MKIGDRVRVVYLDDDDVEDFLFDIGFNPLEKEGEVVNFVDERHSVVVKLDCMSHTILFAQKELLVI